MNRAFMNTIAATLLRESGATMAHVRLEIMTELHQQAATAAGIAQSQAYQENVNAGMPAAAAAQPPDYFQVIKTQAQPQMIIIADDCDEFSATASSSIDQTMDQWEDPGWTEGEQQVLNAWESSLTQGMTVQQAAYVVSTAHRDRFTLKVQRELNRRVETLQEETIPGSTAQ